MPKAVIPKEDSLALEKFSRTVWGNPQAVIKRSGDIEFIDLAEYFDVFSSLFAGPLQHGKVLVRDEYRIARLALETDTYHNGAYVTGQSGIGKTHFLLYLIVTLLGQKSAVALQDPGGQPFYVLFNNRTVSFHSLGKKGPLRKCGFVWALSDSNAQVKRPDATFFGSPCRVRVIQTTSPHAPRWRGWNEQTGARCYVMDIWHEKELADLAVLLELDVGRMINLAEKWGGAPRNLLSWFYEDDAEIMDEIRNCAGTAVEQCRSLIARVNNNDIIDEAPSVFYFSLPQKRRNVTNRKRVSASVPTRALSHILGQQLQVYNNELKLEFFNALSQHRGTRNSASVIFEAWFHNFLAVGNTIQCQWVQGRVAPSLQGSTNVIPSTQDAPNTGKPPFLWVAPYGFHGIDSALVFKDAVYAIQTTIASTHKKPNDGLSTLRENLPNELKNVPWKIIFVGQAERRIKRVAQYWAGKLFFPTDATPLSIAWSAVNPFVKLYPDQRSDESEDDVDEPMEDVE